MSLVRPEPVSASGCVAVATVTAATVPGLEVFVVPPPANVVVVPGFSEVVVAPLVVVVGEVVDVVVELLVELVEVELVEVEVELVDVELLVELDVVELEVDELEVVVSVPAKVSGATKNALPPVTENSTTRSHVLDGPHVNWCVSSLKSVHDAPVPMPTWNPFPVAVAIDAEVSLGATLAVLSTSACGDTAFGEHHGPSRAKSASLLYVPPWMQRCAVNLNTLPAAKVAVIDGESPLARPLVGVTVTVAGPAVPLTASADHGWRIATAASASTNAIATVRARDRRLRS
jgi:hypothetical protein